MLACLLFPAAAFSAELEPYRDDGTATFSLANLNGNTHILPDYKGKVVLVNFWASWCVPCIHEIPSMQQLADSLDDQDLAILTINISDSANRAKETLKRLQLEMTVLLDRDGKAFKTWQGRVLPTSFLLDRSGQLRYRVVGPME